MENFKMYETILLPLVLCGCETWFLILQEEQRLRVIEKRMIRRIFVLKRDAIIRGRRKLHNEELHSFYS
jgi:hypothetical protein